MRLFWCYFIILILISCAAVDDDEAALVPRHFLVFINPVGGPGRGVSDFRQHVQPLFDLAEINYNIIVTGE